MFIAIVVRAVFLPKRHEDLSVLKYGSDWRILSHISTLVVFIDMLLLSKAREATSVSYSPYRLCTLVIIDTLTLKLSFLCIFVCSSMILNFTA